MCRVHYSSHLFFRCYLRILFSPLPVPRSHPCAVYVACYPNMHVFNTYTPTQDNFRSAMLSLHKAISNPDHALVHLLHLLVVRKNRIDCLRHDKARMQEELDRLKETHKRTLGEKRRMKETVDEYETEVKRARRELADALVPGYQRARDDQYLRKLVERHGKRLQRFNLTPQQYSELDTAEQQDVTSPRPVPDDASEPSAHRRESLQLAGTNLPMPPPPPPRPGQSSTSIAVPREDHGIDDEPSLINVSKLPVLCDNCNAAIDPTLNAVLGTLTEEGPSSGTCGGSSLFDQASQLQVQSAFRNEGELPADAEPWESGDWEPAPDSVVSRPAKAQKKPHDTWLNFTKKYVQTHYMSYLIGTSNIRYRNKTYAEHCHHKTIDWDNHAFCPSCYVRYELPKCSKHGPITCGFCAMNSDEVDAKRNALLGQNKKPVFPINRDLPRKCYTQEDCDVYVQANGFFETPNPQWLDKKEEIQGCVPASLIPASVLPKDRRSFVDAQSAWFHVNDYKAFCDSMNENASKGSKYETPSTKNHPMVPLGLRWPDEQDASAPDVAQSESMSVVRDSVLRTERMISYIYGPLKDAEKALAGATTEHATLASAAFSATSAPATAAQSVDLPPPLGLSVLSQPSPALAALMTSTPQRPTAAAASVTVQTRVQTIRSCTPTGLAAVQCDFTCQFGPITDNKTVQTDEHWSPQSFVDTARVQPQRVFEGQGLKYGPWQNTPDQQLPDLYPLWSRANDQTKRVKDMEIYGNEVVTVTRSITGQSEPVETKQLVIGKALPDAYDRAMAQAAATPFNITVQLPGRLGSQNTDESLIQGHDVVNLPDQAGFYPDAKDVVPMTQHEARQHRVIAQMAANTTAQEACVTQKLRGKFAAVDTVEDLRDEVADTLDFLLQRQRDRVQLSASHMTLATLILRRDLMVRCGLDPKKHLLLFTNTESSLSPLPSPRADAILQDAVARQMLDVDTVREVRRRHSDCIYKDETGLSVKGIERRNRYLLEEKDMREARAKLLETARMHQTAMKYGGNRMFESAVRLREGHINDRLREERERLQREELAKLKNRPVEEFQQLREAALADHLLQAKQALRKQQEEGAARQRTEIVREQATEVKQEPPEDPNVSQQVARCSPRLTSSPQPSRPPCPSTPWYSSEKMRMFVAVNLARQRDGYNEAFYLMSAAVVDAVTRLIDRMPHVKTDSERAHFFGKVKKVILKLRPYLLDDDHRKAVDLATAGVRAWALNLNVQPQAAQHLERTLQVVANMFFMYYARWRTSPKAPKLKDEVHYRPTDNIWVVQAQKNQAAKQAQQQQSTETPDAPRQSGSHPSAKVQQKLDEAARENRKPTARMSTSTRATTQPPYVYIDKAEDPAFE